MEHIAIHSHSPARDRLWTVFFSQGYRPFFTAAGLYAVIALFLWIWSFSLGQDLPSAFMPVGWHRHEMLFGVIGAVVAGFLLTAVPNWTGRPPLSGLPLVLLFGLWLLARLTIMFSGHFGVIYALVAEAGFFLALTGWAMREIFIADNRNVPIPFIIGLLAVMASGDYLAVFGYPELADIAYRAGFSIVLLLISLIGGRIVPIFTKNWLRANQRSGQFPVLFNNYDKAVLFITCLALGSWTITPFSKISAGLLLLAGVCHSLRVLRWKGWRTAEETLLLMLHIAYLWVPGGLLLLGASILTPAVPHMAALHALSAGAMGAMTLSVMMRATLGHSGYPLISTPLTNAVFLLVMLGAAGRVIASFLSDWSFVLLGISSGLWAGAYLVFVIGFAPLFLTARNR